MLLFTHTNTHQAKLYAARVAQKRQRIDTRHRELRAELRATCKRGKPAICGGLRASQRPVGGPQRSRSGEETHLPALRRSDDPRTQRETSKRGSPNPQRGGPSPRTAAGWLRAVGFPFEGHWDSVHHSGDSRDTAFVDHFAVTFARFCG